MTDRELLNLAYEASKNAYVPYSNFPVGAALECPDGTIFTGCNVENASYGATLCAERVAVTKAVSEGHRIFSRIAIYGNSEDYCVPCGMCRQFISEFSDDISFVCGNRDLEYAAYKFDDLLPNAFRLERT